MHTRVFVCVRVYVSVCVHLQGFLGSVFDISLAQI